MASRLLFYWRLGRRAIDRPFCSQRNTVRHFNDRGFLWQRAALDRGSSVAGGQLENPDESEVDMEDFDCEDVHELHELAVELPAEFDASVSADEGASGADSTVVSHHSDSGETAGDDGSPPFQMGVTEEILSSRWARKQKRVPGTPQSLRFLVGRRRHTREELEGGALGLLQVRGLLADDPHPQGIAAEGEEEEIERVESVFQEGSREDGIGMMDTFDPRNFALARRYVTSETEDLLQCLRGNFKFDKKRMALYENTISSVLGNSVESIQRRATEMERVGFSVKEVNYLLPLLPPLVSVDLNNAFKVYTALKEHRMNWNMICGIVKNQTHLLLQDVEQVCMTL